MEKQNIETVRELAIFVSSKIEHLSAQIADTNAKLDKLCDCMYGNGHEGVRAQISRHDEFIKQAQEADIIAETRENSEFRNNVKSFVLKVLLAAAGTGGGAAAVWQIISKAVSG